MSLATAGLETPTKPQSATDGTNNPNKALWEKGDFTRLAATMRESGEAFVEMLGVGLWLVQLPVTLALRRLDYELRWYVVTDRAARLREGILVLTEMTFTLVNVQVDAP